MENRRKIQIKQHFKKRLHDKQVDCVGVDGVLKRSSEQTCRCPQCRDDGAASAVGAGGGGDGVEAARFGTAIMTAAVNRLRIFEMVVVVTMIRQVDSGR